MIVVITNHTNQWSKRFLIDRQYSTSDNTRRDIKDFLLLLQMHIIFLNAFIHTNSMWSFCIFCGPDSVDYKNFCFIVLPHLSCANKILCIVASLYSRLFNFKRLCIFLNNSAFCKISNQVKLVIKNDIESLKFELELS